jgi:hypothetical protein
LSKINLIKVDKAVSDYVSYMASFISPCWASYFTHTIHGVRPSGSLSRIQNRSRRFSLCLCKEEYPKKHTPARWPFGLPSQSGFCFKAVLMRLMSAFGTINYVSPKHAIALIKTEMAFIATPSCFADKDRPCTSVCRAFAACCSPMAISPWQNPLCEATLMGTKSKKPRKKTASKSNAR